jgi:tetratricopeptide (TPR) repeat protein
MKTFIRIIGGIFLTITMITADAQYINGELEPSFMAGLEITPEIEEELAAIPLLQISHASITTPLPSGIDNSKRPWFRGIFEQTDGCCGQAAGVGYTYTYEVNRVRSLAANVPTHQYPTHFTYNFLNENSNRGSWPHNGWDVIKQMGVPTVVDYGGMYKDIGETDRINVWETGYEHYYHALSNKAVLSYNKEIISDSTKLNKIKHWLNDHGNGELSGGVAVFCANVLYYDSRILPEESDSTGQWIVWEWGNLQNGLHALTIVGYNDNIMYDFNGDGQFTNEGEIKDWERGAFLVANSWGNKTLSHGLKHNRGFIYVPYRLIDGFYNKEVYCLNVTNTYTPKIVLKAKVTYPRRRRLKFFANYATCANQNSTHMDKPFNALNWDKLINFDTITMTGLTGNYDPIELCLDYGQFFEQELSNGNIGKVFFVVKEDDIAGYYDGTISDLSLIDYRWNETFELPYPGNTSVSIAQDTRLGIPYHLLPFQQPIEDTTLILATDRVARRTVTVSNDASLIINNGVCLDMYGTEAHDCQLIIDPFSSIIIGDNAVITAKRGNCNIVVNGNIQIGRDVTFQTENGATLNITVNGQSDITITDCLFAGASLNLNAHSRSSSNISHQTFATVSNCKFETIDGLCDNALRIDGYSNINIADNIVDGLDTSSSRHYAEGILIYNCGSAGLNSLVLRNTIKGCLGTGLTIYNSTTNIKRNEITKCKFGVRLLNGSTINGFTGNCGATNPSQTQNIHDNDNCEVYVYRDCLPQTFRYNRVTNSGNSWLFAYENNVRDDKGLCMRIDLEYNNWGSLSDTIIANLFHYITNTNNGAIFDFHPKWTFGSCMSNTNIIAERMSHEADSLFDIGLYSSAEASYMEIVTLYPNTIAAHNALKKLLIAESLSNENYYDLQEYYQNDTIIFDNSSLAALARSLTNKCDELLENYDEAIAWYESIIEDESTSFNDSIFATIDLGRLYLIMEENGIKGTTGTLAQFVPKSAEDYAKHTDLALRQLKDDCPKHKSSHELPSQYWTEVVTSQPEGYVVDANGDVQIYSAEGLAWLISTVNGLNGQEPDDFNGKNVTLEENVDMSAAIWTTIAQGSNYTPDSNTLKFCGTFDGNGYDIIGLFLYISSVYPTSLQFDSFWGNLCGATIKNVTIRNVYATGVSEREGLFFANADANTVIDRCRFEVDEVYKSEMNADYAIFGYRNEGTITNCMTKIKKVDYEGHLGINMDMFVLLNEGIIQNCASVADSLKYLYSFAGIAGTNYGLIENCYSYIGTFFGEYEIWWPPAPRQGMCMNNFGTITNCYYNIVGPESWMSDVPAYYNQGTIEQTSSFDWNDGWILTDSIMETNDLFEALNNWVNEQANSNSFVTWCEDDDFAEHHLPNLCNIFINDIIEVDGYDSQITIYPNPAKEQIMIEGVSPDVIQISNTFGQHVKTIYNTNEIRVSDLPDGLYLLRISDHKGKTVTKRFIVTR